MTISQPTPPASYHGKQPKKEAFVFVILTMTEKYKDASLGDVCILEYSTGFTL